MYFFLIPAVSILQSTFDVQSHFARIKLDLIKAIQNPALLIYELFLHPAGKERSDSDNLGFFLFFLISAPG